MNEWTASLVPFYKLIERSDVGLDLIQRARAIIADEIIGCSFQSDNKQDAINRAEEIIAALEAAGIVLTDRTPPDHR
jgi:hypothetical protein